MRKIFKWEELGGGRKRKNRKEGKWKESFCKVGRGVEGRGRTGRLQVYQVQAPPPTGEYEQCAPKMYQ